MLPLDDLELQDEIEERAAIQEHDGKLAQEHAEQAAETAVRGLRPYQANGIEELRARLAAGAKRVIFYLPTGGGKTECAGELVSRAEQRKKRVAFICPRIELVSQASARFYSLGINHGIMQGANTRSTWQSTIVGSIQTIDKRGIDNLDMIIVDEAHGCAASEAYHRLFAKFPNIPIVGLTATPFSKGLGKHYDILKGPLFEDIVVGATIPELIRDGYLVDCDIFSPSEPDLEKIKIVAGEYEQDQLGKAVDKPELIGDIVEHWKRLGGGMQTICFATNIAHSKHIVEQFIKAGVKADHIDAYTEDFDRKRIIKSFRDGEITILSNVSVLAEGFDVPAASVMILARPTRSLIRYIQMAGRVLRIFPGKEKATILDHSGTCRRLGYPTDDLPLELDDGKPKDSSTSKTEKEKPLPKLCPSCKFLKPASTPVCPNCGFKPERQSDIEVEKGELQKMSRDKKSKEKMQGGEQLYRELMGIQRERGYKEGWTANKYREATGEWPGPYLKALSPVKASSKTISWVRSRNIAWAKSQDNNLRTGT